MKDNGDFKIYTEIISYRKYIREHVLNTIPSIHRDLRIHLMDEVYLLLKNMISAINTKGNIRMKYITDMIISIQMLDIISNDLMEYTNSNKKYITTSISKLTNIKHMTYAYKQSQD